jgi:hypothetical protein
MPSDRELFVNVGQQSPSALKRKAPAGDERHRVLTQGPTARFQRKYRNKLLSSLSNLLTTDSD